MSSITLPQLHTLFRDEATVTLIDVRPAQEYRRGHVPGAVNVPLDEIPKALEGLDRAQPLYFICLLGKDRSVRAAQQAADAGFQQAAFVEGGYHGWVFAKQPSQFGLDADRRAAFDLRRSSEIPPLWQDGPGREKA